MADESTYDDALSSNYKKLINQTSNFTINPLMWETVAGGAAIYGYLFPTVGVITFFTNALGFFILMQNITPVNLMLSAISLYDWVTCLVAQPTLIFLVTLNKFDWVPYEWCTTFKVTLMYIPATFHTASLWATVFMAAQRYFVVRKPFSKHLVTRKLTVILIIGAFVIGFAVNFLRMFDSDFEPVEVQSKHNSSVVMKGCVEKYAQWISDPSSYFSTFFIVKAIFQNFLPSITLLVLNCLLIRELRIKKRLRSDHKTALKSACTRITTMLIAILVANLCVELPTGFLYAAIVSSQLGFPLFSPEAQKRGTVVIDTLLLFSNPLNFVIYCAINKNFISTFRGIFCRSAEATSSSARVKAFSMFKAGSGNLHSSTSQETDLST